MKIAARIILRLIAVLFCVASLIIPISGIQISKNKVALTDMQGLVQAIKAFQAQNGRLPNDDELDRIAETTPRKGPHSHQLSFGEPPGPEGRDYPEPGKHPDGWVVSYWEGEWFEYYSSWDDHYSMAKSASWWGFCGPLLFLPFGAVILFKLATIRALRK